MLAHYYHHPILVLALTLLTTFHEVKGGAKAKTYDDILKSLKHPEKLVFDVSQPLNEKLNGSFLYPDQVYGKGLTDLRVQLSPIVYYEPGQSYESAFAEENGLRKHFKVVEPSTILLNRTKEQEPPKGYFLASKRIHNVNRLGLSSATILNIDILLEESILSYSGFKSHLRQILSQQYEIFRISKLNTTIYMKFNLFIEKNFNLSHELHRKYYFYLLQFAVFWLNDEEENEGIILESFNSSLSSLKGFDGTPLRELLAIEVDPELPYGACQFKAMMDQLSGNCSSVTLEPFGLIVGIQNKKCILNPRSNERGCIHVERDVCNRPSVHTSMPDINLRYYPAHETRSKVALVNLQEAMRGLPWKLFELHLGADEITNKPIIPLHLADHMEESLPPDIIVACGLPWNLLGSENLVNLSQTTCDFVWSRSKVILWRIGFDEIFKRHPSNVHHHLLDVEQQRQQFLKQFPDKSIKLLVYVWDDSEPMFETFMCNPDILNMNVKVEVIMHFARMHNIPIEIRYGERLQRWRALETVADLERDKLRFPVHGYRDYPDKFLLGEFHTDPCLGWTDMLPGNGIVLDRNYAGTTLYMGGLKHGSLASTELRTLLRFALHKFSLVELVPETHPDLDTIIQALSRKIRADGGSLPNKLYLNIDMGHIKLDENIFKEIGALNLAGIHLSNWSMTSDMESFIKTLTKNKVAIGLSLEDCVDEVNNHFQNVRNFPLINHVNYILCNVKRPQTASNMNRPEVAKYLDSTLYIRKYFERMLPNNNTSKEIMFRLNSAPITDSQLELILSDQKLMEQMKTTASKKKAFEFLIYFSDVGRYAGENKMKFFMFPAFDDMAGSKYGWWRLSDSDDLTNASVVIEKEAEYLGEETWRPSPEKPEEAQSWILYSSLGVGLFMAVLIATLLLIRFWHQRQFTLLSRKEVAMFRNGNPETDSAESAFDCQKFPAEFDIPKSRFILTNIIGKGVFGAICNATLLDQNGTGSTAITVKIPHPDCSKDSFERMLSELKVLCYVGSHPHILEFAGAYVKEIGKGIVYIATVLCEKGTLQEHLQNLNYQLTRQSILEGQGKVGAELAELQTNPSELYRFAHEIALGMEHIASKQIVHGDLSTKHVLLDSNLQCKISNFAGLPGKLHELRQNSKNKRGNFALPWRWLAVESLKGLQFTTKTDVWSYGVTLWEIFSLGSVPYPGRSYTAKFLEDLQNGVRLSAPTVSNDATYEKMKQCWELNPDKRPTFTELSEFFDAALTKHVKK